MRRALLGALVVLSTTALRAEGPALTPAPVDLAASLPGGWRPEAGGWVMYKVAAPNLDAPKLYRLACTGTEKLGAQAVGYWLEMADAEPNHGSVVVRMLLAGDRRDRAAMRRLMIWAPPQPPFELPASELPAAVPGDRCTSDPDAPEVCGSEKAQALGSRALTVPAGTYRARGFAIRKPGGDRIEQWLSDRVPLIGLVKLTSSAGVTWELVGAGRDAVSHFPDDVAKLDVAGMRKFAEELEKARGALPSGDLRDEAHGGTDPLEGGAEPLPP